MIFFQLKVEGVYIYFYCYIYGVDVTHIEVV